MRGVGELVVDGETGFLIRELDPETAEHALVQLLADGDLLRCMGGRPGDSGRGRGFRWRKCCAAIRSCTWKEGPDGAFY